MSTLSLAVELDKLPMPVLAKLIEEAQRQQHARRCPAYLYSGPSCLLETGHDGPHEGETSATLPGPHGPHGPQVMCVIRWEAKEKAPASADCAAADTPAT